MTNQRVPSQLEQLCGMVQKFLTDSSAELVVTPETRLSEIGVSSLNLVRFVVGIESAFEFEFDDDEMDFHSFQTIKDLAAYVALKTEREALVS